MIKLTWLLPGAVVGLLACGDSIVDCCADGGSTAVLEGFVLNDQSAAMPGLGVRGEGYPAPCETGIENGPVSSGMETTDLSGWFRLGLEALLSSPGAYCVDIIVSDAGVADTIPGVEIQFFEGVPPDTVRMLVRTSRVASLASGQDGS